MYQIEELFENNVRVNGNKIVSHNEEDIEASNQAQTEKIFSDKWTEVEQYSNVEKLYEFQFDWFLRLYGFDSEESLKNYLSNKKFIIDTGCGLGYKAAWFAKLAPQAIVIGIDISEALDLAAKNFSHLSNLYFLKGDIAKTGLKTRSIDFVVCDQVIMHTEIPEQTFAHLSDITSLGGEFACYVYSKKALPRELIDDYFRKATHDISNDEMWKFSEQLTELGKRLSELNIEFESPDIPLLGIKGGKYDIQRFIYWNFLKCFWRDDWGFDLCKSTNYDWYAPSNAKRFSKEEFLKMIMDNHMDVSFFHAEEACYSGRFLKK
ncbi:class I SAM-dependent methyltransferase [Paracnuella aquatica]|uniref:class I SAM-dependent methyltransferase n=1 Tax=Paracnuella aquatica TaxID=2268757 RepID=UPI000DEEDA6C|nr:class I SAM-dependent methyltransferase [Paracnuella aquatica]RPD51019.1 class I SAM-dependent methyltransferase [Paracnuella aquatica]